MNARTCIANIKRTAANTRDAGVSTALVIQGGGMRGTYSMGVTKALADHNLGGAFDHVFGSSAGAFNGAYLLAGQPEDGLAIYVEELSNEQFISFKRPRKIVDIDFMIDDVIKDKRRLNQAELERSRSTLHVILMDMVSGQPVEITNRDTGFDFFEAMRATAALPILYNKIIPVNGGLYADGGIVDSIPLYRAIHCGCTDILVVLTRPPEFERKPPNPITRMAASLLLRHCSDRARDRILGEDMLFERTMEALRGEVALPDGVRVACVYPSDAETMVSRTTIDRDRLIAAADMARRDMESLFFE